MADAGGRNGTYYVPCLYRTAVVPSDDQLPAPSSCSLLPRLLHCPSIRVHDRKSSVPRHRLSHHRLSFCSEAESHSKKFPLCMPPLASGRYQPNGYRHYH
ncbi:hypothetical protein D0864_04307 [Hortaea werneckii]|uniref:Uncharacterized protein n=1 Tax=Hortaea werneckii TaxID=91943 RepID=A0A3M7GBV8_HORWE|nr:hypothetical protein D0864_04307 [Hortaea werneckii]